MGRFTGGTWECDMMAAVGLILFAARSPEGELGDDDLTVFEDEGLDESLSARWCIGLVLEATGVNLTAGWRDEDECWIPPERVRTMAAELEAADVEALGQDWSADPVETRGLVRWFRLCADLGLGVNAL